MRNKSAPKAFLSLIFIMALILLCFSPVHALDSYSLTVDASSQSYTQTAPVTISGILTDATTGKPTSDALVGITVTDPNGNIAYETIVTTATNGTFTTSYQATAPQPIGTYTIVTKAGLNGQTVATATGTFTVTSAATSGDTYNLSVTSNNANYLPGSLVTILGTLTDATTGKPASGLYVGVTVTDPNGNTAYETIATTASNGTFTTSFTDESGNAQPTGTYTMMAVASYSGVQIATASGNFTVNAATTLDVSELISSSQILNGNGSPQTSFAPGSTAKIQFGLEATTGTPSVVWAITLQQGTLVYNIVNVPANINTSLSTESFSQFIPVSATGTWTATIQVYASNGITPVGVTTLTFTIS